MLEKRTLDDQKKLALQLISNGFIIVPLCSDNHRGMSIKHIETCKLPGNTCLLPLSELCNRTKTTKNDINLWISQATEAGAPINLGLFYNNKLMPL